MTGYYEIQGPAVVSFSGGLTSAFMLRQIIESFSGNLPPDVFVVFANTGKEREETLRFVEACAVQWGVVVHWVERDPTPAARERGSLLYRETSFADAKRDGEPFRRLIEHYGYLPNPAMRFCTTELKIRVIKRFMMARGYRYWSMVLGIRADEPERARRLLGPVRERWEHELPLFDGGVRLVDVESFWLRQPFGLQLLSHEGNCDLCFLKRTHSRLSVIAKNPLLADWWVAMEENTGQQFVGRTASRRGEPPYSRLKQLAGAHNSGDAPRESAIDCVCHD